MTETDYAALPDVTEGLEHRLYRASRRQKPPRSCWPKPKQRYTHARLSEDPCWRPCWSCPPGFRLWSRPCGAGLYRQGGGDPESGQGAPYPPLSASLAELERPVKRAARFAALEARPPTYIMLYPGLAPRQ